MKITRREAEDFYAAVFARCHEPDFTKGRWVSSASSDVVSTSFLIRTAAAAGDLEVSVVKADFPTLSGSVSMRFKNAPVDYFPPVDGLAFDRHTGKWNIYLGSGGFDEVLATLSRRLDAVQGRASVALATEQQLGLGV